MCVEGGSKEPSTRRGSCAQNTMVLVQAVWRLDWPREVFPEVARWPFQGMRGSMDQGSWSHLLGEGYNVAACKRDATLSARRCGPKKMLRDLDLLAARAKEDGRRSRKGQGRGVRADDQ